MQFAQERETLDVRWKQLQREAHPDKFAAQGQSAQRLAMQWSVRINEAYQRLKNPLKRATYLCELNGVRINAETNTAMPSDFLIKQMVWREALDDAESLEKVQEIAVNVNKDGREQLLNLERLIDEQRDFHAAAGQVRRLMFVERFTADVGVRLDLLEQQTVNQK